MSEQNDCPQVNMDCLVNGSMMRVVNRGLLKAGLKFVCQGSNLYPQCGNATCSETNSNNWTTIVAKDDCDPGFQYWIVFIALGILVALGILGIIIMAVLIWRKIKRRGCKQDEGENNNISGTEPLVTYHPVSVSR